MTRKIKVFSWLILYQAARAVCDLQRYYALLDREKGGTPK
jgi:hypothetical protein